MSWTSPRNWTPSPYTLMSAADTNSYIRDNLLRVREHRSYDAYMEWREGVAIGSLDTESGVHHRTFEGKRAIRLRD